MGTNHHGTHTCKCKLINLPEFLLPVLLVLLLDVLSRNFRASRSEGSGRGERYWCDWANLGVLGSSFCSSLGLCSSSRAAASRQSFFSSRFLAFFLARLSSSSGGLVGAQAGVSGWPWLPVARAPGGEIWRTWGVPGSSLCSSLGPCSSSRATAS